MIQRFSPAAMLLMAVLLVFSAGLAGCTSQSPSVPQAPAQTPAPAAATSIAAPADTPAAAGTPALVLSPSEVPGNFTLDGSRERTAAEMSSWAIDHGWKKGYTVVYRKNESGSSTFIMQNISVYSAGNATLAVADTIDGQIDSITKENNATMTVEKITLSPIGDASGSLKYTSTGEKTGMYIIAFSKNGVFEDIETNGNAADYEAAKQLALIAAAKIP